MLYHSFDTKVLNSVFLDNDRLGFFFRTNFGCEWDEYSMNSDALKQVLLLLLRFQFYKTFIKT